MSEVHESMIFMGRKNCSDPDAPTVWDETQRAVEEPPR